MVVRAAISNRFLPVVSQQVLEEIKGYVARNYSSDVANKYLYQVKNIPLLNTVPTEKIVPAMDSFAGLVTDKDDLPHVTACILEDCNVFVTIDRKLTQMKAKQKIRFASPKQFVELLGMRSINTSQDE